ncbi:MAG: AraC family transcriptional regulator [bacterium]|nr:AraC family transcriptional regulator [bacterium]
MNYLDFSVFFCFFLTFLMALGMLIRSLDFRNVTFALMLVFMGYLHFYSYLYFSKLLLAYPHFFFIHIPVSLSLGPLVYFYVLSLMGDKNSFVKKDLLHFIPALVMTASVFPYILYNTEEKREFVRVCTEMNGYASIRIIVSFSFFVAFLYFIIAIRKLLLRLKHNKQNRRKIFFFVTLLIAWMVVGLAGIIEILTRFNSVLQVNCFFTSAVIICSYLLNQKYPHVLLNAAVPAEVPAKKKTYTKSHLNNINLDELNSRLGMLMKEEKFYCDEDLSLARLSEALEITPHQLSQFLNKYHKKNFNSYINSYRIADARKLLLENPSRNTLSIAYAVGFNSYSAFHSGFKKETCLSPAEFRRNNLN